MKKIVITGGACSGKTSVINALSKKGYKTVEEAAIQIVTESVKTIGIDEHKKEMFRDFKKFAILIAERQLELESKIKASNDDIIFLDRGIHDCIAFCKLMNVDVPKKVLQLVKKCSYDCVFLLENISNFNPRKESGRITADKAMSIRMKDLIKETYSEYGYNLIYVKEMPIESRIRFIEDYLSKSSV